MNQGQGGKIISVAVIVILMGTGAYFAFHTPAAKQPIPTPSNATPTTSQTKTYHSTTYGFELQYPADGSVVENGPDPYELQLRDGKQISGTQAPLLESIDFQDQQKKTVLTIEIPDQKNFPVVSGDDQWSLRTCGEEGFAVIKSQEKTLIAGYKTLHVISTPDTNAPSAGETHFYCVNFPKNPLIIYYSEELKGQAEAIRSTIKFAETAQASLPLPPQSGGPLTPDEYRAGPSAPSGYVLPSDCSIVGAGRTDVNSSATYWDVDCGAKANMNSRATLEPTLRQQGWTSCGFGLAHAEWWKNGVLTGVAEGDGLGSFQLSQSLNAKCQ